MSVGGLVGLDLAAHLGAVDLRQIAVEQDHVGRLVLHARQRAGAIARDLHDVAAPAEHLHDQPNDIRLVVDYQDARHYSSITERRQVSATDDDQSRLFAKYARRLPLRSISADSGTAVMPHAAAILPMLLSPDGGSSRTLNGVPLGSAAPYAAIAASSLGPFGLRERRARARAHRRARRARRSSCDPTRARRPRSHRSPDRRPSPSAAASRSCRRCTTRPRS